MESKSGSRTVLRNLLEVTRTEIVRLVPTDSSIASIWIALYVIDHIGTGSRPL